MGNEERERKFEQALERHLRRDAAGARHEEEARADVRDGTGRAVTCLDAETLAAFHEQILSSEEMNIAAEHIESCSRCQQILMQLEATDEIPLQIEPKDIFAMREPVLPTGAQYVDETAMQTPGPRIAGQSQAASKAPKDISRGRRFKALRWAAPAGAIAAGLLVWFVARDSNVKTSGHVENVQVAQEQPRNEQFATPRALPASPAPEPVTKSKQLNEPRKDAGKIKRPGEESGAQRAPERPVTDAFATAADLEARAETSDANVPAASRESKRDALQATATGKPESRESRQNEVAAVMAAKAAAATAPAPSRDQRAQSAVPIGTPPTVSTGASGAARSQPATPAGQTGETAATESANTQTIETHPNGDSQLLATQQVVALNQLETPGSLKKVGFENAKIILAPNGAVLWRVGAAGRIEQSVDSGVTWRRQISGVKVELLAGSAASEALCWIVGRSGTILRTTDGGGHWGKVVSPMGGDVAGVEAVDAKTAEIFNGSRSVRFITHDGGATWEAVKE
jgi:Photosynthesis system II assembly factor YCF48